jgi:hypothetical protein
MRTQYLLLLALCVAVSLHAWSKQSLPAHGSGQARDGEAYLLPPAMVLEGLSLNAKTFAADMVWVRALIYFGEQRESLTGSRFENLDEYAETVIQLDPTFYPIYNWITAAYMATRGEVTHEDILAMNTFLERGMAHFPTQYELPYRAGLNAIGYSNRHTAAQRVVELTEGIRYLERCMKIAGCPDNTAFVVSWMYSRRAQLKAEIAGAKQDQGAELARERAFLLEVYPKLTDPALRARMRKQLLAMGVGEAQLDALEREQVGQVRLDYEARAPYLPLDLWALTVSPRP